MARVTLTVNGTGFSKLTVINFFSKQGTGVVNLGGLTAGGAAKIALTFVNEKRFTFKVPSGAMLGPSYDLLETYKILTYSRK